MMRWINHVFFFPLVFVSTDSTESTAITFLCRSLSDNRFAGGAVNVRRGGQRYQDTYHTYLWQNPGCHPSCQKKNYMITKVNYSKSPAKTINYILNPKKGAHVVLAKGVSSMSDVDMLVKDFERQSALRPSLSVKAVHIPISFHVNDKAMLESHADEILNDWIRHMGKNGYRFDQYIVGRHHDKDDKNPHFHLMANVVLNDGTRANLANIGKAAKEASISVTEQWHLTPANHRKNMPVSETDNWNQQTSASWKTYETMYEEPDRPVLVNHNDATESAPAGIGLIEGFAKLIIQPEVTRIGTGSGSSDNTLDRDNEKNRQRKGGRRR